MVITNVGGSSENYMEWNNVYSEKGGNYVMTISYVPPGEKTGEINDRIIEVMVNGFKYAPLAQLEKMRSKGVCSVSLPIQLNAGFNVIRIGSLYTWTPDIDCFTLKQL